MFVITVASNYAVLFYFSILEMPKMCVKERCYERAPLARPWKAFVVEEDAMSASRPRCPSTLDMSSPLRRRWPDAAAACSAGDHAWTEAKDETSSRCCRRVEAEEARSNESPDECDRWPRPRCTTSESVDTISTESWRSSDTVLEGYGSAAPWESPGVR